MKRLLVVWMVMVSGGWAQPAQQGFSGVFEIMTDRGGDLYSLRTEGGTFELRLSPELGDPKTYWRGLRTGNWISVPGYQSGRTIHVTGQYRLQEGMRLQQAPRRLT